MMETRTTHKLSFWIKQLFILILFSVVVNHLTNPDSFSFGADYHFPLYGILTSIILGAIIILIIEFTYRYYESKVFQEAVTLKSILQFLFTTLGILTIIYIPIFYLAAWINDDDFVFHYMLIGLLVTLMICVPVIALLKGNSIYQQHKKVSLDEKVVLDKGSNSLVIPTKNIAYFYSEQKVVHAVQTTGESNITSFTLNEIEEKSNNSILFRANRQYVLHPNSVKSYQPIENGKLQVSLFSPKEDLPAIEIIVSRYKKTDFINWFKSTH